MMALDVRQLIVRLMVAVLFAGSCWQPLLAQTPPRFEPAIAGVGEADLSGGVLAERAPDGGLSAGGALGVFDATALETEILNPVPATLTPASSAPVTPAAESDHWIDQFISFYDPEIAIAREQSYLEAPAARAASGTSEAPKPKKWYDKLSIRGYAQFRINEDVRTAAGSAPPQSVGDRS
ncbi:MAG: hypothetical protein ACKPEY_06325, partial [Planctomycetota bacterium]